jgi:hypothetical protein
LKAVTLSEGSPCASRPRGTDNEGYHYVGMHDVQTAKLHDDQEQEDNAREARTEEILPLLPNSHGSQGDEIRGRRRSRRPVAQRLEHRSPKPGVGGSNPFWPATNPTASGSQCLSSHAMPDNQAYRGDYTLRPQSERGKHRPKWSVGRC